MAPPHLLSSRVSSRLSSRVILSQSSIGLAGGEGRGDRPGGDKLPVVALGFEGFYGCGVMAVVLWLWFYGYNITGSPRLRTFPASEGGMRVLTLRR